MEEAPGAMLGWILERIQVSVIRASSTCVRCTRFKSGETLSGFEDGPH